MCAHKQASRTVVWRTVKSPKRWLTYYSSIWLIIFWCGCSKIFRRGGEMRSIANPLRTIVSTSRINLYTWGFFYTLYSILSTSFLMKYIIKKMKDCPTAETVVRRYTLCVFFKHEYVLRHSIISDRMYKLCGFMFVSVTYLNV